MDKIKIEQLFSIAITREIESYEFYQEVSNCVENSSVKQVFQQLANEEMQHKETLEKLKMNPELIMKFKTPQNDYKIAEATQTPDLDINMKPADAIALAMKREQDSVEFYRSLAEMADDAEIKKIFENLVNMELSHKTKLESVFIDVGYPEAF